MILRGPFMISSRLMAAVKVGDGTISLGISGKQTRDGRDIYTVYIDLPEGEFLVDDMCSGCGGGSVREGFSALLVFLCAAGEAYDYKQRTGDDSENSGLFPPAVNGWAAEYSGELDILCAELDEHPEWIEE